MIWLITFLPWYLNVAELNYCFLPEHPLLERCWSHVSEYIPTLTYNLQRYTYLKYIYSSSHIICQIYNIVLLKRTDSPPPQTSLKLDSTQGFSKKTPQHNYVSFKIVSVILWRAVLLVEKTIDPLQYYLYNNVVLSR